MKFVPGFGRGASQSSIFLPPFSCPLVLLVVAGALESSIPGGMEEESGHAIIVGFCIISLILLEILALILGLVGVFARERNKVFAFLGIGFSGLAVLGAIGIIVIGLTMA